MVWNNVYLSTPNPVGNFQGSAASTVFSDVSISGGLDVGTLDTAGVVTLSAALNSASAISVGAITATTIDSASAVSFGGVIATTWLQDVSLAAFSFASAFTTVFIVYRLRQGDAPILWRGAIHPTIVFVYVGGILVLRELYLSLFNGTDRPSNGPKSDEATNLGLADDRVARIVDDVQGDLVALKVTPGSKRLQIAIDEHDRLDLRHGGEGADQHAAELFAVGGIDLALGDPAGKKSSLVFGGTKVLLDLVDVSGNGLVRIGAEQIEGVLACKPDTDAEHNADGHQHKKADGGRQRDGDRHPPVPP